MSNREVYHFSMGGADFEVAISGEYTYIFITPNDMDAEFSLGRFDGSKGITATVYVPYDHESIDETQELEAVVDVQ